MAQKLTIEFQPKGNKELVAAIKELNRVTKQLQSTTGDYKNRLDKVGNSYKKVTKAQKKYNKGGITAVKHNRLLSHSLATLRSRMLIVAFGAAIVTKSFKAMFEAAIKQEKAERKLEAQLGKVNTALLNHAAGLQKVTEFGDEAVIEVQSLIAAFTKDEHQIKSLTEATLDLAAAKGMDLTSAADLVAKSFGSSTNSLSRYGIEVRGVVGSSERLESLTENISELFGGQAVASADTLGGSVQQMKNAFGDANEAVGKAFAPTLQKLLPILTEAADAAREFILGATEDPLETAIRRLEELGINADEYKKEWLEIQRLNIGQELGLDLKDIDSIQNEIVKTTKKLKDETVDVGGAVKEQADIVLSMGQDQEKVEKRINKAKLEQFARTFGVVKNIEQYYTTTKKAVDVEAQAVVNAKTSEITAKQNVTTTQEKLKLLYELLAIAQKANSLVEGDDDDEGGFFSKLFGKFGNEDEMAAMADRTKMWSNAILDIGNSYVKLQQMQLNQSKQEELGSAKSIRNERLRQKKIDEINEKFAAKQEQLNKKSKKMKRVQTVINNAVAIMEVWADKDMGLYGKIAMSALVAAAGLQQLKMIDAQKYQYGGIVGGKRHSQGGTMIEAEQGEFVMSRDAVEAVGIENLNRMNTGLGGGGGSTIVINNPVLGKDMIEDEIVPQIQEALRRGGSIA